MASEKGFSPMEVPLCDCGDADCPGTITLKHPFEAVFEPCSNTPGEMELYLRVRTTSWDFDGERTDLHDVLSLLWALNLRAKSVASVRLISALNPAAGADNEIHTRFLALGQPGQLAHGLPLRERAKIAAEASFEMDDLMTALFGTAPRFDQCGDPGYDGGPENEWITRARKVLNLEAGQGETRARSYPNWVYFGSHALGFSVVDLGLAATDHLRSKLASLSALEVEGVHATLYQSGRLLNAARKATINLLEALIAEVDGEKYELLIVPIDSHVIAVGKRCVAAIRDGAGRDIYTVELERLHKRREKEARFLHHESQFEWSEHLDDARFEALVEDLLLVEQGVVRVRQVGDTRERDDGRDLLVDWWTPPDSGNELWQSPQAPVTTLRHVAVQVKIRRTGVGRNHLRGLRDTLEYYQCGGLLVVAFPRVTSQLTAHLEDMRRRGQYWVEWWGRTQLEQRLRQQPHIAGRYADLVKAIR